MRPAQTLDASMSPIDTREVWVWTVVLAAVAFWGKVVAGADGPDPLLPSAIANAVIDAGAFTMAAWIMILARAGDLVSARPASPRLIGMALGTGLLCAIPLRPVSTLVLAALGGNLLLSRQATRGGRQAGLLLAALALAAASNSLVPVHVWVADLDSHIVAFLSRFAGMDGVATGNVVMNGDFGLEILVQCTSSIQLAPVVLAFAVIVIYRRGECRRSDLPWLVSALAASVVLTEIRLLLMLRNEADYHWWHDGTGATVYLLAAMASAVFFPLMATAWGQEAPARQPA